MVSTYTEFSRLDLKNIPLDFLTINTFFLNNYSKTRPHPEFSNFDCLEQYSLHFTEQQNTIASYAVELQRTLC